MIHNYTSGKDVYIRPQIPLPERVGWLGPPKPGPQSRALCGAVCALSIAMVLY